MVTNSKHFQTIGSKFNTLILENMPVLCQNLPCTAKEIYMKKPVEELRGYGFAPRLSIRCSKIKNTHV